MTHNRFNITRDCVNPVKKFLGALEIPDDPYESIQVEKDLFTKFDEKGNLISWFYVKFLYNIFEIWKLKMSFKILPHLKLNFYKFKIKICICRYKFMVSPKMWS